MKKLNLLLGILTVLMLCSCSSDDTNNEENNNQPNPTTTVYKKASSYLDSSLISFQEVFYNSNGQIK